jgi:hypothetical protein
MYERTWQLDDTVGGEYSLLNSTHVERQVKGLFGFTLGNIQKSFVIFFCSTAVSAARLMEEPAVNQEAGYKVGGL